ncbi:MAG TPA: helix-turn-helix domain-containing protein [Mycobacteriales bacterium]|nr:helix-turn-helix domain-containing protein [Mycobacteriales bacterium]
MRNVAGKPCGKPAAQRGINRSCSRRTTITRVGDVPRIDDRAGRSDQPPPPPGRWFPAEPAWRALHRLAHARRISIVELAAVVGLDRRTIQRLAAGRRLRTDAADRLAVALACHPCDLWPTWFDPCVSRDVAAADERAV